MSPWYAGEIYCAMSMTLLYGPDFILADCGKGCCKMLELYVVALPLDYWIKFYYSGMELLLTMKDHVNDDLIVLLLVQVMDAKFGSWNAAALSIAEELPMPIGKCISCRYCYGELSCCPSNQANFGIGRVQN